MFVDFALYLVAKLIDKKSAKFGPDPSDYVDAALEWAFDAIKLFPKRKKYIAQFLSSMIRAISAQIVNYIAGKQIKLNSVLNTVAADALVCVVYAILNKKTYNKIKKLNKGIYKNKKLKNEKLKIRIEYKALGKKINHYIEIGDDLFAFVMKVVDRL